MSNPLRPHGLQPTRLCPWGFCRQEYCSGLPCPPPGDLLNPGIQPRSPALEADALPSEPPGKPWFKPSLSNNNNKKKVIWLNTEGNIICSKREGRENMLSQNRSPSKGFANEGQTCARLSSR